MTDFDKLASRIREAKIEDRDLCKIATKATEHWKTANAVLTALDADMKALVYTMIANATHIDPQIPPA